jgi:hypothetical protein
MDRVQNPVIPCQFSVCMESHRSMIFSSEITYKMKAIILNEVIEFDFSLELGYSNSGASIEFETRNFLSFLLSKKICNSCI